MTAKKYATYKAAFGSGPMAGPIKYVVIEAVPRALKDFEKSAEASGMPIRKYLASLYADHHSGPVDITILKQTNPNEKPIKCAEYDRAPLFEMNKALEQIEMRKRGGKTITQVQITDFKQVIPKTSAGVPKTPERRQLFTLDITANEKLYISSPFKLSPGEIKRCKNPNSLYRKTLEDHDLGRISAQFLKKENQRSVSARPEFLKKDAGRRFDIVQENRKACELIQNDPAVRSVHSVADDWTKISSPRSDSSPVSGGPNSPSTNEEERFRGLLERFRSSPREQNRDSGLTSPDSESPKICHEKTISQDSGLKISLARSSNLNPQAKEFSIPEASRGAKNTSDDAEDLSLLRDICPDAKVTFRAAQPKAQPKSLEEICPDANVTFCDPEPKSLLQEVCPYANMTFCCDERKKNPPIVTKVFTASTVPVQGMQAPLPAPPQALGPFSMPLPKVSDFVQHGFGQQSITVSPPAMRVCISPPGLPIPPPGFSLPAPPDCDPFDIPPLPALLNMQPPPGLGFPSLVHRGPSHDLRFPPVPPQSVGPAMHATVMHPRQMLAPVGPTPAPTPRMFCSYGMPACPAIQAPSTQPTPFGGPFQPPVGPAMMSNNGPFPPRPMRKPRNADPVAQQKYEAWIEWQKTVRPGYAMQCKARQARRAQRQYQDATRT